jgi:hydroxypyruvate isomerase
MGTRQEIAMQPVTRRQALAASAAALAGSFGMTARSDTQTPAAASGATAGRVVKNGRLKQSVCRWTYQTIPDAQFYPALVEMGLTAVDLLQPNQWETLKPYGLTCSMGYAGAGQIPRGLNDPANHDTIIQGLTTNIPLAAKAGVPNVITFFGNVQPAIAPAQALDNCVTCLNKVKKIAEDNGVTICVELLNSKVNHRGYQGDHTQFGVDVVKAVASPRVKLLYDIYHMQIMDGDIIATIRREIGSIAHFHTGGVPGRHELDDTQELNWRGIAKAIVDLGYTGYFAHEFQPTRDPLTSLREAVGLCDV